MCRGRRNPCSCHFHFFIYNSTSRSPKAKREGEVKMAIEITESALKKIKGEMSSRGLDPKTTFLRIGVHGGGCSGFSYQLEFDTERAPKDKTLDFPFPDTPEDEPKLTVLVDIKSYLLVNGASLDYSTQGLGGFTFTNPNAKSTCGCGQSFSAH